MTRRYFMQCEKKRSKLDESLTDLIQTKKKKKIRREESQDGGVVKDARQSRRLAGEMYDGARGDDL